MPTDAGRWGPRDEATTEDGTMGVSYNPPHAVLDKQKLAEIIESFRLGKPIPAVVGQGYAALTGSHRIAAHDAATKLYNDRATGWEDSPEPTLDMIEVADADYQAACRILDVESHHDLNLFAAALYCITDDEQLKAALADQRGDYEDETVDTLPRYA
jgi:hypothetical protein